MSQRTNNPDTQALAESIEDWLVAQIAIQLKLKPEDIDSEESFINYGLSSVQTLILISKLEKWLSCKISPTLFWNYPTIRALSQRFSEEFTYPQES